MTRPVDIVALGAHPDDVELGCGGALLLAAASGLRTAIVDFTAGERSSRGGTTSRSVERETATRLLCVAERECLGLPDGELHDSPPAREALIAALRRLRPRVVVAPIPEDRHPDHAAVGNLARAACFLSGVPSMGSGRAHRPASLFHYQLHHPIQPSFVVDITPVWEAKWGAITAYESQFGDDTDYGGRTPLSTGSFLRTVEARSVVAGAMVGVAHGEPYWSAGPVGMAGLPGAVAEDGSYRSVL